MSERYIDASDAREADPHRRGSPVRREDLITSMPIDRNVARALATENVVRVEERTTSASPAKTKSIALKQVKTPWQGDKNPRLWNWVRADREDATAEDVAASLFSYARSGLGGDETSFYAYGLAAAPPMFGLPVSWAVRFPDAVANAPQSIKDGKLPDPASDTISSRMAVLATSSAGDEIAIKQAGGATVRDAKPGVVLQAVDDVVIQLSSLRETMTEWGLAADLIPVIGHMVEKRRSLESASPTDVHAFAAVVLGQRERLVRIAGAVRSATAAARKMSPHRDARNPIRPVLARYAEAASSSELQTTSEGLIAQAQSEQQALVIKSLQTNELAADQAMDELHAGPAGHGKGAADLSSRHGDAQTRARTLENTLLAGGTVNQDELERVQLDEQQNALEATMFNLAEQLKVIDEEAANADSTLTARIASLGSSKFRSLGGMSQEIRLAINKVRQAMVVQTKSPAPRSGDADGLAVEQLDILAKRDALTRAQAEFEKLRLDHDLKTFIPDAYKIIKNQKLRTAIVGAAAMIGLSMVGAGLGNMARTVVGEGLMAAEAAGTVGELAMGARAQIAVAGMATEVVANSTAQTLMTGESTWKTMIENTIFVVGTQAISANIAKDVGLARGFHAELEAQVARLEGIEAKAASQTSNAAKLVRAVGRESLAITGHTIMGMALGAVASKVIAAIDQQKDPKAQSGPGWEDTVIQGASVAVGRLVHTKLVERKPLLEALAQHDKGGQRLLTEAAQLEQASIALTKSGDAKTAIDVLQRSRELTSEEVRKVDELLARPDHGGNSVAELKQTKAELQTQLGDAKDISMINVQLHLAGLRELDPNAVWSGTRAQVDGAVADVKRTIPEAQVDEQLGTTTVRFGDHVLTLHEDAPSQSGSGDQHQGAKVEPKSPKPTEHPSKTAEQKPTQSALKTPAEPELSPEDRAAYKRVEALDAVEGARLVAEYGNEITEYLRTNPLTTLKDLATALGRLRKQVNTRTKGFYEGIDTANPPTGWTFTDKGPYKEYGTNVPVLETRVKGPNGAEGYFVRAYDPHTKELELRMAFLKLTGKDLALPNKIVKQGSAPEMIEGEGSPTVQYITLYQMKKLGVPLGDAADPGIEKIHMSDIQNVETIVHLHYLRNTIGGDLSDLIEHTASVKYAETTAIQTGYERAAPPLITGGQETPIGEVCAFQENGNAARRKENDRILDKYGFKRDTVMMWGFDVDFRVRPSR